MKTKKKLLLITIFVFMIAMFTVASNKVLAAIPEGMSEEFKNILNEDGKLVVKDTTMRDNKYEVLNEYLSKYNGTNYNFYIVNHKEDFSTCKIARSVVNSGISEEYEIEVVFQEEFSEEFKSILKNGKLEIRTSNQNNMKEKISRCLRALSEKNPNYTFSISNYYDGTKSVDLINEDCTKVTIRMGSKSSYKTVEQHVVEVTCNSEKSEEFKNYLNKNGKIEMNAVKPANEIIFERYFEFLLMDEESGNDISFENLAEDFSSVDLTVNGETHNVGIVYNYNNDVKTKFDNYIKNFPSDIEYFQVRDLELINYWVNNVGKDGTESLDMFSGELKSYLNYKNMKFYVDNRAGDNGPFYTVRLGIAVFKYDDVIYNIYDTLGTRAEHIIYVPSETSNTKEALMAAAQKRINEYLGKEGIVTISYAGTAYEAWAKELYNNREIYWPGIDEAFEGKMTFERFLELGNDLIPTYNDFEEVSGLKGLKENDETFIATIKVGNKQESFHIVIKNDSSKMVTPSYKTADITTDIEISSNSSSIPLDTSIKAEKITSGTEYEKIIKLLDVKENAMFDLKLYSDSLEKYITKLDDGTFEVKIPVPENLKGKKLIAYYVTGDGKTEEYEVEVKDGYAIFNTKHFSIYTLAETKTNEENNNNNEQGNNNENGSEENGTGKNETNKENENIENSPRTGDNIVVLVGTLFIAVIGTVATIKFKRYNKTK